MEKLESVTILLVEDDKGDQKLVKMSLLNQKIANKVVVVESGEEAFDYLARNKAGDSDCPQPNLILLDLNMPGMGGKEFLKRIKANDDYNVIPVVILTTSDSEQDIIESYKLHAAGYIKKPVTLSGFEEVMQGLEEYWFAICKRT